MQREFVKSETKIKIADNPMVVAAKQLIGIKALEPRISSGVYDDQAYRAYSMACFFEGTINE
jgi:hypothetical protein